MPERVGARMNRYTRLRSRKPMRRSKPMRRVPFRRKRRPPRRIVDPEYRAFILAKPCLASKRRPVEGHHVRRMTGMGVRSSDYRMVPIWWKLHGEVQGRDRFWWEEHGIDVEAEIRRLNEEFFALTRNRKIRAV